MKINQEEFEEKQQDSYRYYLYWFILISILLHLCVLLIFFNYGFKKKIHSFLTILTESSLLTPEEKIEEIKRIQQKREKILSALQSLKTEQNNRPARLRAPKSSFGWVLFDDPPKMQEQKQIEIPTTIDGDIGQAALAQATEDTPKTIVQEEKKLFTEKEESSVIQEKETTMLVKSGAIPEHTNMVQDIIKETDKALPVHDNIQEKITRIKALQQKIDSTSSSEQSIGNASATITDGSQHGQAGVRVRGAQSSDAKPKRNIIALTKGFIEKWDGEEGTDLIDRDGDGDKQPSLEELKYISYESKITWCLQAAWKQNFCYRPWTKNLEGDAVIEFSIDQHGKLMQCNLLQSTGHKELDDMIIKNMKFASPFPPLPKHFGVSQYHTGRLIQVRSDRYKF